MTLPAHPVPTKYRCDCGAIAAVAHPCGGCGGQRIFGLTVDEVTALRALFAVPTRRGGRPRRVPDFKPQGNLDVMLAYDAVVESFQ
jgi:hypothetical protein